MLESFFFLAAAFFGYVNHPYFFVLYILVDWWVYCVSWIGGQVLSKAFGNTPTMAPENMTTVSML